MIGYPTLQNFFIDYTEEHKDELGKVRWIDIEQLLKDYALSKNKEDSFNNDIVQNDRKCFDLLVNSFPGYLKEQLFNACETHLAED